MNAQRAPVAVGKHLYMVNGSTSLVNPTVTLRCVELATGKAVWEKPRVGKYHAAIVRTGNDKLLMLDDNGFLVLFDADPRSRGSEGAPARPGRAAATTMELLVGAGGCVVSSVECRAGCGSRELVAGTEGMTQSVIRNRVAWPLAQMPSLRAGFRRVAVTSDSWVRAGRLGGDAPA